MRMIENIVGSGGLQGLEPIVALELRYYKTLRVCVTESNQRGRRAIVRWPLEL